MDTPKTLAARLRKEDVEAAEGLTTVAVVPRDLLREVADYLDRLPAPDVGVGLTRYTIKTTNDKNGFPVIDPYKDYAGPWVRFEDIATLIAAARAVPAGVEPFGYFCEHRLADPVFLRPPSYIPEPGPNSKVTPLYTAAALAASTARETHWRNQVSGWESLARCAAATLGTETAMRKAAEARDKAKDEEIAGLREALTSFRKLVREGGVPRYTVLPGAALNALVEQIDALSGRKPDKEGT